MKRIMHQYSKLFFKRNYTTIPVNLVIDSISTASQIINNLTFENQSNKPKKLDIDENTAFKAALYNTRLSIEMEIYKYNQENEVMAVREQMPALIERLNHLINNMPENTIEYKQSKEILLKACTVYAENLMSTSNTQEKALPYLDRALKLDPNNEEAQGMKDTLLLLKGEAPDNVKLEYAP